MNDTMSKIMRCPHCGEYPFIMADRTHMMQTYLIHHVCDGMQCRERYWSEKKIDTAIDVWNRIVGNATRED